VSEGRNWKAQFVRVHGGCGREGLWKGGGGKGAVLTREGLGVTVKEEGRAGGERQGGQGGSVGTHREDLHRKAYSCRGRGGREKGVRLI